MATDFNNKAFGMHVGNGHYGMVIIRENGVEWYEEWRWGMLMSGQDERECTISDLLSARISQGMTPAFAASLPRVTYTELPTDFYAPQGEPTVQWCETYVSLPSGMQHSAIRLFKRMNYWKARKAARTIRAWFIQNYGKSNQEYGVLAQFPSESVPRFYDWYGFAEKIEEEFPVSHQ